jgi:CxxC-x17-CxxC domain-containing protein
LSDKTIKCVDCGADFVFTDREQEWYREKGLTHEPRRCKNCRSSRKAGGEGNHGHDDHATHSSAPSAEGEAPRHDRPPRPPARVREMHTVACATCSKETEVPFKPDPSRPVYCRECYAARGKKR